MTDDGQLEIEETDSERTLKLVGELDLSTGPALRAAVDALGTAKGDITLDVAGLDFMDSSGIQVLLSVSRTLQRHGRLILLFPRPPVERVLALVQADRFPNVQVIRSTGR